MNTTTAATRWLWQRVKSLNDESAVSKPRKRRFVIESFVFQLLQMLPEHQIDIAGQGTVILFCQMAKFIKNRRI